MFGVIWGWVVFKFEIIATSEEYIVCKVIQTKNASFMARSKFFFKKLLKHNLENAIKKVRLFCSVIASLFCDVAPLL